MKPSQTSPQVSMDEDDYADSFSALDEDVPF
jgi:hypothetical protein